MLVCRYWRGTFYFDEVYMIDVTIEEAIYIMLWIGFIIGMAALLLNNWDRSIKELDKWEDEK